MIVLKGLASLPAKRFRSLAAVAWKTLHAFADHCKSASGNSTACRGKPRNHADPPTPGSTAPAPAGHAPNGPGSKTRFDIPKTEPAAKTLSAAPPVWPSTQYARGSPARIRPESARIFTRTARRQDATGTPPRKNVLKIQHRPRQLPAARQPAPRPAGPPPACRSGKQAAPAAGSTRARTPARPTPRGRSTGFPGRPAPTEQLQHGGSRSGTAGLQPGHRERR